MTDERLRILDKIKKLMALGNSPFEEEARTSLHKAFKLMKEHSVSLPELANLDQPKQGLTDEQLVDFGTDFVREYMREIGRNGGLKGGLARKRKLTPKQRSDIARKAGQASGVARRRKIYGR